MARFASAILWVSSRFFTAVPRLLAASKSSPDRRSTIVFSLRARAAVISQRMARACRRSAHQPCTGEGLPALRANLDRYLVGGAADATRADFDGRHDVVERRAEQL